jgi:hypothetical protein
MRECSRILRTMGGRSAQPWNPPVSRFRQLTYGPGRTWLTFHLHDIRLVGPNCIGLINNDPFVRFNATFALNAPLRPSCRQVGQERGAAAHP